MRFHGKRAVVTGGASGIGRATALRLAAEGARVFVGDVDDAGGGALAAESNGAIVFRHTDVTKEADIVALLATADADGGVDVLFNNAGAGGGRETIGEIAAADWDATMALLLRSVALGIFAAGTILAVAGFPARATPGTVPVATIDRLTVTYAGLYVLLACAAAFFFTRFPFGRAEHEARLTRLAR